jgi:hypothetical protein
LSNPWNITEDMTNFIRRILNEESKSGKVEWTLNEIIGKMVELVCG